MQVCPRRDPVPVCERLEAVHYNSHTLLHSSSLSIEFDTPSGSIVQIYLWTRLTFGFGRSFTSTPLNIKKKENKMTYAVFKIPHPYRFSSQSSLYLHFNYVCINRVPSSVLPDPCSWVITILRAGAHFFLAQTVGLNEIWMESQLKSSSTFFQP